MCFYKMLAPLSRSGTEAAFWILKRHFRFRDSMVPTGTEILEIREELLETLKPIQKLDEGAKPVYSRAQERSRANNLFSHEQHLQKQMVGRIEKIEVKCISKALETTLLMNKKLSTPNDCARHFNEHLVKACPIVEVNGEPWDMHRPLQGDCSLNFLGFRESNGTQLQVVNKAFWRSCSFLMGASLEDVFRDEIPLLLHSFPPPNVRSGSFVYDVHLPKFENWSPDSDELRVLSAQMVRLSRECRPIERLEVDSKLALDIFRRNHFKVAQIPNIASQHGGKIVLYRVGNHIDISRGPMIGNSSFVGRCSILAVHSVGMYEGTPLLRFQGVALPSEFIVNHYAFGILESRAKKQNTARIPGEKTKESPIIQEQVDNIAEMKQTSN